MWQTEIGDDVRIVLRLFSYNNKTVLEDLIIDLRTQDLKYAVVPVLRRATVKEATKNNAAAVEIARKASSPAVAFVVCALYCQSTIPRLL